MKPCIILSITILVMAVYGNNANSAIRYVSYNGNDQYPGSQFKPLLTIQKAADISKPGDTIFVMAGLYNQLVKIKTSGTNDKPIVYEAIGNVVLNGPHDMKYWESIVLLDTCNNITIKGFQIQNSKWFGIKAEKCNNIRIIGNRIDNTGASGIYVRWSKNVTVKSNEISRACAFPYFITLDGYFETDEGNDDISNISAYLLKTEKHGTQECMSIVSTDGFDVSYNIVHESGTWNMVEGGGSGSGGEGIDVKESCKNGSVHHNYVYNIDRIGIYCDAWLSLDFMNVKVYNNVVHNCRGGISVSGEAGGTVDNLEIFNNLVYNTIWGGITLNSWGDNGSKKNIKIFNNTVYRCHHSGIALGGARHSNIEVYNNLLYQNADVEGMTIDAGKAVQVRIDHNLMDVDPLFRNLRDGIFTVREGSPAIDAGKKTSIYNYDLNGNPRISGNSIDIGAFEFIENK